MASNNTSGSKDSNIAKAHEEFERRTWEELHPTYDSHFGRITAQAADALLSAVEITRGTKLLEVACGTGNISGAASSAGAEVVGIDFVEGMIVEAKKLHSNIEFRVADAQALPFDDDNFDAVICNFGVHHFSDPLRALKEAYRVIKTGGYCAFTVWSPPSNVNLNLRQIIREAVDNHADVKDALPPGPQESFFASPENCLSTLDNLGFSEVSTEEIPLVGRWAQPEQVLDTIYHAMIRSKTLIEAQSPPARKKIEVEIVERAGHFIKAGTVEIPMPAMLTRARKT
jgi:ubiquinone/menaquinone biosynthesis C-methylase UbiE